MSGGGSYLSDTAAAVHPAVRRRHLQDVLWWAVPVALALALALAAALVVAKPNLPLTIVLLIGLAGLITLIVHPRLEVTVTILAVFLGCLDGPVKGLAGGGNTTAVLRNVLVTAVVVGALARLLARREPVKLPPMVGWVIVWTVLVLVEILNPNTIGVLKILGGIRQQLEWVPFFFFGWALIRSRDRMRKMFLILGLIACANGIASAIESRMSAAQFAALGPGYAERAEGVNGVSGTAFKAEGESHIRPLALGSDIGFGGSIGVLALPGALVLLTTRAFRRRWVAPLLCTGALVAVVTSLSRTAILGAIITLLAFGLFSLSVGKQMIRPLLAIFGLLVVAVVIFTVLSSAGGSGLERYASIAPESAASTATSYKELSLKQIPKVIEQEPFGFGLGTAGAASGFGGKTTVKLEGHGFSSETQYNFVVNEVGAPGLIAWIALTLTLLWLGITRLRSIADLDARLSLAAILAALAGLTMMGFEGAFMAGQGSGPYFWFAAGVIAFWLAGRPVAQRLRARGEGASPPSGGPDDGGAVAGAGAG